MDQPFLDQVFYQPTYWRLKYKDDGKQASYLYEKFLTISSVCMRKLLELLRLLVTFV